MKTPKAIKKIHFSQKEKFYEKTKKKKKLYVAILISQSYHLMNVNNKNQNRNINLIKTNIKKKYWKLYAKFINLRRLKMLLSHIYIYIYIYIYNYI